MKLFATNHNLSRHINAVHEGKKINFSSFNESTNQNKENSRHQNKTVEKLLQCKFCYKTFRRECAVKQHEEMCKEMKNKKLMELKSTIKFEPIKIENYQEIDANKTQNNGQQLSINPDLLHFGFKNIGFKNDNSRNSVNEDCAKDLTVSENIKCEPIKSEPKRSKLPYVCNICGRKCQSPSKLASYKNSYRRKAIFM